MSETEFRAMCAADLRRDIAQGKARLLAEEAADAQAERDYHLSPAGRTVAAMREALDRVWAEATDSERAVFQTKCRLSGKVIT